MRRAEVRFVDIGHTAVVQLEDIRVLSEVFTFSPPFAIRVALAKVSLTQTRL